MIETVLATATITLWLGVTVAGGIGGNVEEKQCESSDCPVVLYTGEECPVCGR